MTESENPNSTPLKDKPKLAVWKFTSCDGCQLSLLDCEDTLLAICDVIEIAHFLEASSKILPGPYDISLVEGSISTREEKQRIQRIRAESRYVVSIGACATSGGIQALRNFRNVKDYLAIVYAEANYIDTLDNATPISDHIKVDFELRGCPINKYQLLEVLSSFLFDKKPAISEYSVCMECKRAGNVCVMVAHGTPCLGPVTHAGCGALCPRFTRGCYGCYGPQEIQNRESLNTSLVKLGMKSQHIEQAYKSFNAYHTSYRHDEEESK